MGRNLRNMPVKLDPEDHGYDAYPTGGDVDRAARYAAWVVGWKHGATGHAKDIDAAESHDQGISSAYNVGYRVGEKAALEATRGASLLFGHTPSVH